MPLEWNPAGPVSGNVESVADDPVTSRRNAGLPRAASRLPLAAAVSEVCSRRAPNREIMLRVVGKWLDERDGSW